MGSKIKREEKQENQVTLEESWEKMKDIYVSTLEVSVENAKRIDNLLNIRDLVIKFYGTDYLDAMYDEDRFIAYLKEMQSLSIETYERMLDIARTFELKDFLLEDMPDWYAHLIPSVNRIESMPQLVEGALVFLSVKPFGEKMMQMHHAIMDEAEARERA